MARSEREKEERGEKWGRWACFSPWAKQSRAISLSLQKLFLFANHPLSPSPVPYSFFVGPGGSELSLLGGCGDIQVL